MNKTTTWPACALLAAAAALAALPQTASAQSSSARASASGNYPSTLSPEVEKLGNAASAGDDEAQFKLAQRYSRGDGVPRSTETAVLWLGKAAAQGHVEAQAMLGTNYLMGDGTRKDVPLAIKWLGKAAEQGDALAQTNLGALYLNGDGAPQNFRLALQWLEKAAAQGSPLAQYSLGRMYQYGYGVRTDEAMASQWFNKAMQLNYRPAMDALAELRQGKVIAPTPVDKTGGAAVTAPPPRSLQTAAPATPAASVAPEHDAVLKIVQEWATAWSNKRTDAYLGYYADNFVPAGGESRSAWAAQRRERIDGRKRIAVSISTPEIDVRGSTATVTFAQKYTSDNFSETSRKKLILVRQNEGWRILQESSAKLSAKKTLR